MKDKNTLWFVARLIGEVLFLVIYFPFWWYSVGFIRALKRLKLFLANRQESLGLLVWVKNIFRPMYGQSDFAGRMISLMIRLVQIIFRSIAMLFYLLVTILGGLLWLALPVLLFAGVVWQLI